MSKWKVAYYPGNPHPREYIDEQPVDEVAAIDQKLEHMENTEHHEWPWVDHLEGKLWEIKSGPHRLLYFLWFGRIIIVHAARKRRRTLHRNHIERALDRMDEIRENFPEG